MTAVFMRSYRISRGTPVDRLEGGDMAAQDALQVLVDDEAPPDQPAVTEHHREEPDDALNPWLVGELDVELGEVDLRLLAGRRLEAHFESAARMGRRSRARSRTTL